MFDSRGITGGIFTVSGDPGAAAAARKITQATIARRTTARQHARFCDAEAKLAALLPQRFAPGESWNVLSAGDIDALSYVKHIMRGHPFTAVLFACWAISRPAIEFLQAQFNAGQLQHIDAYVGDIMPRDRPDLHSMLCSLIHAARGRCIAFKNHAKVWIFMSDDGAATVMQTSANPNYNRRVEQTTITGCPQTAAVYKAWFDAIAAPAVNLFPEWKPHAWTPAQA